MARKKEQAVMETVSDEVEFVSFIDKPGLNVIDVYQTWCGPCKPVQGMTHRLRLASLTVDFLEKPQNF